MKPVLKYGAIAFAVAALGGGFLLFSDKRSVETARPSRGPAVEAVYASGTVEPTVMMKIAPKTNGRLKELLVDEGANVTAGQVLARLDAEEIAANVDQLDARVILSEREATRARELLARGVGTAQNRDKADSDLRAARGALNMAKKQMSELTLLAPADGHVIRRDGEIGELIMANQTLFYMACCAPSRIEADVDEEDIPMVKIGQTVMIRSDSFLGQNFTGTVSEITPKGDPVARSFRVRIALPSDTKLMIGMTVENNIIIRQTQNALLVASTALSGGKLWLVEDGKLARKQVSTGVIGPEKTEILAGLDENADVVLKPADWFAAGKHVRIAEK